MSAEESRILRGRAETFLRHAEEALKREEFDFSCFSAEQAAQLYLKSLALEFLGEVPRTHSVRELLSLLMGTVSEVEDSIRELVRENRQALRILDESYVASRYLTLTYDREDAEMAVDLAKKVIRLCVRVQRRQG